MFTTTTTTVTVARRRLARVAGALDQLSVVLVRVEVEIVERVVQLLRGSSVRLIILHCCWVALEVGDIVDAADRCLFEKRKNMCII